jgi:hypothetical protein
MYVHVKIVQVVYLMNQNVEVMNARNSLKEEL